MNYILFLFEIISSINGNPPRDFYGKFELCEKPNSKIILDNFTFFEDGRFLKYRLFYDGSSSEYWEFGTFSTDSQKLLLNPSGYALVYEGKMTVYLESMNRKNKIKNKSEFWRKGYWKGLIYKPIPQCGLDSFKKKKYAFEAVSDSTSFRFFLIDSTGVNDCMRQEYCEAYW